METELDFDPMQRAGDRSNQSIVIDNGKYVAAIVVCAVVCGLCAAVSWWSVSASRDVTIGFRDESLDIQDQYQKERNHVIELEARLKILGDEVEEMQHVRR